MQLQSRAAQRDAQGEVTLSSAGYVCVIPEIWSLRRKEYFLIPDFLL